MGNFLYELVAGIEDGMGEDGGTDYLALIIFGGRDYLALTIFGGTDYWRRQQGG